MHLPALKLPRRSTAMATIVGLTVALLSLGASPAAAAPGDVTVVAGTGGQGYSGDGGPALDAELNRGNDVTFDNVGNMIIDDQNNNVIRKVDGAGIITTIAGNGGFDAHATGDGGLATAAGLGAPAAAQTDSVGNLFIADNVSMRVRRVDHLTGIITTVAGDGTAAFGGDGGPATAAQLKYPNAMRLDTSGNIFIGDCANGAVRRVDHTTGVITTVAGTGSPGFSGDSGPATTMQLGCPNGVALNSAGDIFIGDYDNSRVWKVDHTTGNMAVLAGDGSRSFGGDGGPSTASRINGPVQLAVDTAGNVFVSDTGNNKIRKIDTSGIIHTIAANDLLGSPACSGGWSGANATALDGAGNLFLNDTYNDQIRRITAPIPNCITPVPGVIADFDQDFKTDVSVFRPSGGTWFDHPSGGGPDTATSFGGVAGDIPVPGEYDGDFRTDIAIYRPSSGLWAIRNSSGGDTFITFGGVAGDLPVPADFDGDGKTDLAVYRPSFGIWYVHRSSDSSDHAIILGGVTGDIPIPADFDGDGRADKAIFRPGTGTWYVHPSGADEQDYALSYGTSGDIPLPVDFDGDHLADIAIFRPSTGLWAIHPSGGGPDTFKTYGGISGDVPIPADYDGDQKADIAIFRPSLGAWYVNRSTTGVTAITTFGISTDIPLQLPAAVRKTFFP